MTKASKCILGMDSTVEEELCLKLVVGRRFHEQTVKIGTRSSHRIIESVEKYLASRDLTHTDLSGLVVRRGPGSFTSLRVGVAIANALCYALKVPLVGERGETWFDRGVSAIEHGVNHKIVEPLYSHAPHVTAAPAPLKP